MEICKICKHETKYHRTDIGYDESCDNCGWDEFGGPSFETIPLMAAVLEIKILHPGDKSLNQTLKLIYLFARERLNSFIKSLPDPGDEWKVDQNHNIEELRNNGVEIYNEELKTCICSRFFKEK